MDEPNEIRQLRMRVIKECAKLITDLCRVDQYGWQHSDPFMNGLTKHNEVMIDIEYVIEACNRIKRGIINRRFE